MININYLAYHRKHYSPITFEYIKKIKEENKKNIHVSLMCSNNEEYWQNIKKELLSIGISCECVMFGNGVDDYMQKINLAISVDFEYSIKMDDDCFINNHVWDYIIENIHSLDDDKNLSISPLMSIGIPTTDRFTECFFDENEREILHDIYEGYSFRKIWGADYSTLNPFLKEWNAEKFYDAVAKFPHYYKGIHPIRFSRSAQIFISNMLLTKQDLFKKKNDYSLITINAPYQCNSFFAIKTLTWRNIITDRTLFVDNYDEVPFNLYRERNNLNFLYVDNSFGIHAAYGCVDGGSKEIENSFINYSLGE